MFALVSRRYERASMIVTSQPPSGVGRDLRRRHGRRRLIDRLIHHAEILTLKGDSYRLKERGTGAAPAVQAPGLRPSA